MYFHLVHGIPVSEQRAPQLTRVAVEHSYDPLFSTDAQYGLVGVVNVSRECAAEEVLVWIFVDVDLQALDGRLALC